MSYCSTFYGVCISIMRLIYMAQRYQEKFLSTSLHSLLLYGTTTTFSRMSPDSNSDHELNGALYTE